MFFMPTWEPHPIGGGVQPNPDASYTSMLTPTASVPIATMRKPLLFPMPAWAPPSDGRSCEAKSKFVPHIFGQVRGLLSSRTQHKSLLLLVPARAPPSDRQSSKATSRIPLHIRGETHGRLSQPHNNKYFVFAISYVIDLDATIEGEARGRPYRHIYTEAHFYGYATKTTHIRGIHHDDVC